MLSWPIPSPTGADPPPIPAFSIFQYYLTVVPTTYIDASNRHVETSQYSVTSQVREVDHGRGVPGIFFKYDLEPVSLSIHERTTTFYQFAVRLVGVIGASQGEKPRCAVLAFAEEVSTGGFIRWGLDVHGLCAPGHLTIRA